MSTTNWKAEHLKRVEANVKRIDQIYQKAAEEAALIGATVTSFNPDKPFNFADYPHTKYRIDKTIEIMTHQIQATVVNGVTAEWKHSNFKNDQLAMGILGYKQPGATPTPGQQLDLFASMAPEAKDPLIKKYFNNNDDALQAFLKRKTDGLGLSDRVWNYTQQFKQEIELGLDNGIRNGHSAAEIAKDLKQFLNEPDRVYKRFHMFLKDDNGNPILNSKGEKIPITQLRRRYIDPQTGKETWKVETPPYKPGRGVYRSSRKNAMRLSRTENNMAYKAADHARMMQFDFVVGFHVEPSKSHKIVDICDTLKGDYPKDFKFVGWHPQCMCPVTFIMKTPEELAKETEAILSGDPTDCESKNLIEKVPSNFSKWVKDNAGKIDKAPTTPYFIKDNFVKGDITKGLKPTAVLETSKAAAAEQAAQIAAMKAAKEVESKAAEEKKLLAEIDMNSPVTAESMLDHDKTQEILESLGEDWAAKYHANPANYKKNTYYRVETTDSLPSKGYGGAGNGLYLGKDEYALKAFYDIDGEDLPVTEFEGEPKWLNLMDYDDMEAFENYLKHKGITMANSDEVGKIVQGWGFDGIQYYDPMATGEEFVLFNTTKLVNKTALKAAQKQAAEIAVMKKEATALLKEAEQLGMTDEELEVFKFTIDGIEKHPKPYLHQDSLNLMKEVVAEKTAAKAAIIKADASAAIDKAKVVAVHQSPEFDDLTNAIMKSEPMDVIEAKTKLLQKAIKDKEDALAAAASATAGKVKYYQNLAANKIALAKKAGISGKELDELEDILTKPDATYSQIKKKIDNLNPLIGVGKGAISPKPQPTKIASVFSKEEIEKLHQAHQAFKAKIAGLPPGKQIQKLEYEIDYVKTKTTYSTKDEMVKLLEKDLAAIKPVFELQTAIDEAEAMIALHVNTGNFTVTKAALNLKQKIAPGASSTLAQINAAKSKLSQAIIDHNAAIAKANAAKAAANAGLKMNSKGVKVGQTKETAVMMQEMDVQFFENGDAFDMSQFYTQDEKNRIRMLRKQLKDAEASAASLRNYAVVNAQDNLTAELQTLAFKYLTKQKSIKHIGGIKEPGKRAKFRMLTDAEAKAEYDEYIAMKQHYSYYSHPIGGVYKPSNADELARNKAYVAKVKAAGGNIEHEVSVPARYCRGSSFINDYLLGSEYKGDDIRRIQEKYSGALSYSINKLPRYNGFTYRGCKNNSDLWSNLLDAAKNNKPFIQDLPMSTSTSIREADAFGTHITFKIYGKSGVYCEDFSYFNSEKEVMYRPGSKFKILDMYEAQTDKDIAQHGSYTVIIEEILE